MTVNEPARRFEDLVVWRKAHAYVLSVYGLTKAIPHEEQFGLTSQFRRAAVSVAANIAEGFARVGKAEKIRFLNISQGPLEECRYYALLSRDLGCGCRSEMHQALDEVGRLLQAYSDSIRRSLLRTRIAAASVAVSLPASGSWLLASIT